MSQPNCNTGSRKNKYITERERYNIELFLKEKYTPAEIAERIGKSVRTIQREIKRGMVTLLNSDLTYRKEYCADTAQMKYEESRKNKGRNLKIGNDYELVEHIEKKIKVEKFSPDVVIGQIKAKGLKFKASICTKTLYSYIDKGLFLNISNADLPIKRDGKKRDYRRIKIAHKNLKGTSIEERPEEVELREEYGHWEMDCVVGKANRGSVLLVLSERKTRQELIFKMAGKTQECVVAALDSLEKKMGYSKFCKTFKTITTDNGGEFLDFKGIERSSGEKVRTRTKMYYAHPYSSWERGTNENTNKLIRRFIPKGADIGKVSNKMIKRIEKWINNYPRRIFGYLSSNDMMLEI